MNQAPSFSESTPIGAPILCRRLNEVVRQIMMGDDAVAPIFFLKFHEFHWLGDNLEGQ